MDLKKLLSTTPETLAREQYDALRAATVSLLGKLAGHIARDELEEAEKMLFHSYSGDGNGCDNLCVNFDDIIEHDQGGCSADIGDVITRLMALRKVLQPAPAMKGTKK